MFYIQYGMKYVYHFSTVLKGRCDVMVQNTELACHAVKGKGKTIPLQTWTGS